jgi:hypothetical protein
VQQPRQQGCDAAGTLWIKRVLGTLSTLEGDKKHVEMMADADEEIKKVRKEALSTMSTLEKVCLACFYSWVAKLLLTALRQLQSRPKWPRESRSYLDSRFCRLTRRTMMLSSCSR